MATTTEGRTSATTTEAEAEAFAAGIADLEQHRERVHRDASLERDRAYDRAIAKGIDADHAKIAAQNAYNAHYARNGHPDDSMTRHTRQWVAIERRVQAAVKLGANYWTFSDPVATARAHRATAARTTTDHRRDAGTRTSASRRRDTGQRATGGRGDDDPDDDGDPRLAAALELHALGFHVLPLLPRDKRKRPHFAALTKAYGHAKWGHLREAAASDGDIRTMHGAAPDANWAVIPAGDLVIVDVDDLEAFAAAGHTVPATPTVKTRRGFHYYFRDPTGTVRGKTVTPWGEIHGPAGGNYCVAPPSIHHSGHEYTWAISLDDASIAELPAWATPSSPLPLEETTGPVVIPTGRGVLELDDEQHDALLLAVVRRFAGKASTLKTDGKGTRHTDDFHCVLPDHGDGSASAVLYRGKATDADGAVTYSAGDVRYKCRAASCLKGHSISLGEFAARMAGATGSLLPKSKKSRWPSGPRWKARLLFDLGALRLDRTPARLPAGASENARTVAEGFLLLADLRAQTLNDRDATPFSRDFAAAWCGVGPGQARAGIDELVRAGWLTKAEAWEDSRGYLFQSSQTASGSSSDAGIAGSSTSKTSGESSIAAAAGSVAPSSSSRIRQIDRCRSNPRPFSSSSASRHASTTAPCDAQRSAGATAEAEQSSIEQRATMRTTVPGYADRVTGTVPAQGHDPDPPPALDALDAELIEGGVAW